MLKRRPSTAPRIIIEIDGAQAEAAQGDTVAAAVLAHSDSATRATPVSGSGRAPYCMMGVCFECLMEIDGIPNRQACMVTVAPGMRIVRQLGARRIGDRA